MYARNRHHRAHSKGWARQQADMLGLAGLINALTRERMNKQLPFSSRLRTPTTSQGLGRRTYIPA